MVVQESSSLSRVHFITMGCAKNEVDTRDMKIRLYDAGVIPTDDIDICDIVVVNTCSFIQSAVEESIDVILDVINDDRIMENKIPVVVAGCMPSRYGKELEGEFPEAASFIPCSKEDDIVQVVKDCLEKSDGISRKLSSDIILNDQPTFESQNDSGLYAYVKISDGCDRFCTYCTIPYIRGRYHSFSTESIEKEVRKLVDNGIKEIVLIGQDTGIWGNDLEGEGDLSTLLSHLAETFPDTWFRVMYTQPENVSNSLLDAMREHDNIASYLDIPFQHCSESILKSMNRTGSTSQFLELLSQAREKVPGIAIRTTLMVGFPGETEQDFEELISFVEDAEFDYVGMFSYSREDGTKAASLPDQVDEEEKEIRLSRLRDLADSISNAKIAKRIGSDVEVLVEGIEEDGQLFGRSYLQAPEVDGITFIDEGDVSNTVKARIDDTLFYDMEAARL